MVEKYRGLTLPASPVAAGPLEGRRGPVARGLSRGNGSRAARGRRRRVSRVDATQRVHRGVRALDARKGPGKSDQLTGAFDAAEACALPRVLLPVMPTAGARNSCGARRVDPSRPGHTGFRRWKNTPRHCEGAGAWPRLEVGNVRVRQRRIRREVRERSDLVAPNAATPHLRACRRYGDQAPVSVPPPAPVTIDQFMAIELRVAKVLAAVRVPKSKKLIEMRVDAGTESGRSSRGSPKPTSRRRSWAGRSSSSTTSRPPS